ncbi:amidinotransferase, partial [Vibrio splendidus]
MLNLHKKSLHITNVQNANCVVMVPPKEFRFNEETARD